MAQNLTKKLITLENAILELKSLTYLLTHSTFAEDGTDFLDVISMFAILQEKSLQAYDAYVELQRSVF